MTVTNIGRLPAERVVVTCGPDPFGNDNMITTALAGLDDQRRRRGGALRGTHPQREVRGGGPDITTVTGATNVASERFTVCGNGRFDRPATALTLEPGPKPLRSGSTVDGHRR
ncbi:hypothetical protein [Actinophytocola sp.]|uniref:hypothetical protein n=1 Tax=Actinophytocola sp. TaxID=1872138 RepID=UPI002ED06A75